MQYWAWILDHRLNFLDEALRKEAKRYLERAMSSPMCPEVTNVLCYVAIGLCYVVLQIMT